MFTKNLFFTNNLETKYTSVHFYIYDVVFPIYYWKKIALIM